MSATVQMQAQEAQRTAVPLLDQRFAVLKKNLVKREHKKEVIPHSLEILEQR
jgi:hypothetical protein